MDVTTKILNEPNYKQSDYFIGLTLAVSSSVFIGSSFIIKKLSLIKLSRKGVRAAAGGFGYLKDWLWWLGFLTMVVGEVANFAAYAFAPASLVTPLGALSVLVNAILASKFLKESMNIFGKLGCLLCVLGSTIMVLHAPKKEHIESVNDLFIKLQDPAFLNYVVIILVIISVILCYLGPRYGSRHVIIYITLCSAIGSLTVMGCKAISFIIRDYLTSSVDSDSDSEFNFHVNWLPVALLLFVIISICLQINYLNKALDLFTSSVVTPIYYVIFTTLVMVASAILFKEWSTMEGEDIFGALCGFLITIIAIYLLNAFKDCQNQPILIRATAKEYGSNTYLA